ncbi:MAG: hypothetical protein K1000chlam2_00869 [Chlamydiae bacterium]|nr:hypothetical protein [Chlamydiota bacterium]
MKIYGDETSSQFKTHIRESGTICGYNDVLMGDKGTCRQITFSFFGNTDKSITVQPRLYFHISNTAWSLFTGMLRKNCLPWRWKVAYLDQEDGKRPQRILVCTSVKEGELSDRLSLLLGKSLFVANLINANCYDEIFGQEYFRIPGQDSPHKNRTSHPLGKWFGEQIEFSSPDSLYHMHRVRGISSLLKYYFLKHFSREWEEVAIQAGQISKNVLIERNNRSVISELGLISRN